MKPDVIYFLMTSLETELGKIDESKHNNAFLVSVRILRTAIKNLKKFF
jgi:hypothetical protein